MTDQIRKDLTAASSEPGVLTELAEVAAVLGSAAVVLLWLVLVGYLAVRP